jgi:short-subunit dehydrogenase
MAAYCAAKAGVEQFGNVLRWELAHAGVAVGTAFPGWVDTDLVRDARADLPSVGRSHAQLPWPLDRTVGVQRCARALVRAIERRSRRVYVPGPIVLVQALRTVISGRLFEAAMIRASRHEVARLEADVRALGRSFGASSMGLGREARPDRE